MAQRISLVVGAVASLVGVPFAAHAQATAGRAEFVNVPGQPAPPGYSHAVVVRGGQLVFLSGQVAIDATGRIVGKGDFPTQVARALDNLRAALAAVGATPADLVKLNYYVVGLDHDKLIALREARDRFIDRAHPPASTLAGVQVLFNEDCLVEIEAVATVPERK